eukprot:TRINITY_DN79513_c0_g1_i1.p2 TRINITY_DN79513_c0_g1~~TRINITY_DN79513_c0_g1_i1.p2  ORF type:complete len:165 (+),score=8.95 TRINITY_DN79513_c0_g1_i1:306-800(+)
MNEQVKNYRDALDRELGKYKPLSDIETKTGVPKVYSTLGVCAILFIFIIFDLGAQLIVNLAGFLYPAYQSFKALETARKTDDEHWLTYWIVFGLFNTLEYFKDAMIYYIPFFYVFKLAFLLWLYLPWTNGARTVYLSFIRPAFLQSTGVSNPKKRDDSSSSTSD